MRDTLKLFVAGILSVGLAATALSCNSGSGWTPTAPSVIDPAPPVATIPVPGRGPNSTSSTVSWACVVGNADRSVSSGSGWTIQGEPCPPPPSYRDRTIGNYRAFVFAPAPTNLRATVTGTTVQLNWDQPGAAFAWQLEAGSEPTLSNIAVVRTTAGTSLTVTGVPPGRYYVRVRSAPQDFSDLSLPSNEITVIVGGACTGPPQSPTGLHAVVAGNSVTLGWTQPFTGQTAASYVLEVGSVPGSITYPVIDTGSATTNLQATAANGLYYVRVRARNACGTSGPSNEIIVSVGAPLPSPPAAFFEAPNRGSSLCSYRAACDFNATRSSGTGLTYFWDFGDGATTTGGPLVYHQYARVTARTVLLVRLTVTDSLGRTSSFARNIGLDPYY